MTTTIATKYGLGVPPVMDTFAKMFDYLKTQDPSLVRASGS